MKISYNSPLVLNFSLACIVVSVLNFLTRTNGLNGILDPISSLGGSFSFGNITDYLSLFLYPLNHANPAHLLGNLSFILLLGPILEEKYGKRKLAQAVLLTIIATAILNILLFSSGIIGASGIVFTFIILVSITNSQANSIPLTFIIIFFLYVGKEVYAGFSDDQISQFGHIMGGIVGAIYGFAMNRKTIT